VAIMPAGGYSTVRKGCRHEPAPIPCTGSAGVREAAEVPSTPAGEPPNDPAEAHAAGPGDAIEVACPDFFSFFALAAPVRWGGSFVGGRVYSKGEDASPVVLHVDDRPAFRVGFI
jgi:hypothetical protein